MVKCQICKENEAEWAMQYIGDDEPQFYTLGWHTRGFRVTKVCDECQKEIKAEQPDQLTLMDEGS